MPYGVPDFVDSTLKSDVGDNEDFSLKVNLVDDVE